MQTNTDHILSVTEQNGQPKSPVMDPHSSPMPALTEEEKIDLVAARILERFKPALEELAK